jgi:hypothetical protein
MSSLLRLVSGEKINKKSNRIPIYLRLARRSEGACSFLDVLPSIFF